jgi:hypothetical protein
MRNKEPYPECKTCKDLGDCKHPEIAEDMLGSPLPPDNCPKPIEIMINTLKKKKIKFSQYLNHGLS